MTLVIEPNHQIFIASIISSANAGKLISVNSGRTALNRQFFKKYLHSDICSVLSIRIGVEKNIHVWLREQL